jgi:hypothetical protein
MRQHHVMWMPPRRFHVSALFGDVVAHALQRLPGTVFSRGVSNPAWRRASRPAASGEDTNLVHVAGLLFLGRLLTQRSAAVPDPRAPGRAATMRDGKIRQQT